MTILNMKLLNVENLMIHFFNSLFFLFLLLYFILLFFFTVSLYTPFVCFYVEKMSVHFVLFLIFNIAIYYRSEESNSRPQHSIEQLIIMALKGIKRKCTTIEIINWIEDNFGYFKKTENKGWQNL